MSCFSVDYQNKAQLLRMIEVIFPFHFLRFGFLTNLHVMSVTVLGICAIYSKVDNKIHRFETSVRSEIKFRKNFFP